MMHDGGFFVGGYMWIFWLILIVVVMMVIKNLLPGTQKSDAQDTPLDILKKRYARGEIDAEEYAQRRSEIER